MGKLAERLDAIQVRVKAPGAEVEAELRNRRDFTLYFGDSVYEFIDEKALERALASLARLLYAGWQREYMRAIEDTSIRVLPDDQYDINFREESRQIEVTAESHDGRVKLSAVGMDEFTAEIEHGTLRKLKEHEFANRVAETASLLLDRHDAKATELQMGYYG